MFQKLTNPEINHYVHLWKLAGEQRSLLSEMDISEPTLSQECMSVYRQLRSLVSQLKSHSDDDSGLHSDCSTTSLDDSSR